MSRPMNTPARSVGKAPGVPAHAAASIEAVRTMVDRMENGLCEVRDLAHAVRLIAEGMAWAEADAVQRVAGCIMDRAEELKTQQSAAFDALCSLTAGATEASNG